MDFRTVGTTFSLSPTFLYPCLSSASNWHLAASVVLCVCVCVCVCVCLRERKKECVCVYVCVRSFFARTSLGLVSGSFLESVEILALPN